MLEVTDFSSPYFWVGVAIGVLIVCFMPKP